MASRCGCASSEPSWQRRRTRRPHCWDSGARAQGPRSLRGSHSLAVGPGRRGVRALQERQLLQRRRPRRLVARALGRG
eukprot:3511843-Alexandrium_andersonii.AAC.1